MTAQGAQLEIRVLSGFAYRRAGASWHPPPSGLVGELLYLLAVGGPTEADVLCQALWPGAPQRWATGRMIDVRARLRRSVGDVVAKDGDRWSLSDDLTTCDLWEVNAHLAALLGDDLSSARRHLPALLRRYPDAFDVPIARPAWSTPAVDRVRAQAQERLDALRCDVMKRLSGADQLTAGSSSGV